MMDRWLVVFSDLEPLPADAPRSARALHWALAGLLKPGFRHVFAARPLPGGYLVANPHSVGLDLLAMAGDQPIADGSPFTADDWWHGLQISIAAGRVAAVWAVANRPGPLRPRLLTCVSTVKHLLGCDGWAVTPFQLYRQLTKET